MILNVPNLRVIESDVRRILAAIRFVDAVTGSPVIVPAIPRPRRAELIRAAGNVDVPFSPSDVPIRRNPSGFHVLYGAPHFAEYVATFEDPEQPAETNDGPLRINMVLEDAGPSYLPQSFSIELPRSPDPESAENVFEAQHVRLLRTPAAGVRHGWAALRVSVTEEDSDPPVSLPGVLLRVFRSPRGEGDEPIGLGMTEWRGRLRGEALVIVAGVQRFRPGSRRNVIASDLSVTIEAARMTAFTGAPDEVPDLGRLLAAIPDDLDDDPDAGVVLVREAHALDVRAGREQSVELSIP